MVIRNNGRGFKGDKMNWQEIKNMVMKKCFIKEINPDTIEFTMNDRHLRLHRFEIPEGFEVSERAKEFYNNRVVLMTQINGEWRTV